jgi:hypothetical protein
VRRLLKLTRAARVCELQNLISFLKNQIVRNVCFPCAMNITTHDASVHCRWQSACPLHALGNYRKLKPEQEKRTINKLFRGMRGMG